MSNTHRFQFVLGSPIGPVGVTVSQERVDRVEFLDARSKPYSADAPFAAEAAAHLTDYFSGRCLEISLPLNLQGTDFQKRVWLLLAKIKPGEIRTYGDIAKELDSSPRAVGNACRSNPVPIIIPCHRVVSASGIGGFAGATSGRHLDAKRWLLAHEGISL
jgi:methylated-DNA-[protein]-cysteine S-methyltransferase